MPLGSIDESSTAQPDVEDELSQTEILTRYADMLETHFPRAVPDAVLIKHVTKVLGKHGFNKDSSINLISTCRDEICRPFTEQLDRVWGSSFNISSLAGFCFCGRTGFKAAMAHAPVVDGIERYVFWVAPHIGLTLEGEVGKVYRPGRAASSSACGAMIAAHNELKSGRLNISLDPLDLEQSLLKQQLVNNLHYGHVPSLVELTYRAYEVIFSEVYKIACAATEPTKCEFVIIGGIQIHGPLEQNFFWPGKMIKVAKGGVETDLYEAYAASVAASNVGSKMPSSSELQAWCLNTALANLQLQRRKIRLAAVTGNVVELKRAGMNLASVTDNQRRSLLHIAALNGQLEVVKLLLSLDRTLIGREDTNQMCAIDYAVQLGNDDIADVLFEHGCSLTSDKLRDPLVEAVEAGDIARFKRLFRFARDGRAAVASAADKDGRSLLHICLAARAVHVKDGEEGAAADEQVAKYDAMLQELFSCCADWGEQMDFFGNNVLTEAQRSGSEAVAKQVEAKLLSPTLQAVKRGSSIRGTGEVPVGNPLAGAPSPS